VDQGAVALKKLFPEILLMSSPPSAAENPFEVVSQVVLVPLPEMVITWRIPSQKEDLDTLRWSRIAQSRWA
jgi:hypothetical protein